MAKDRTSESMARSAADGAAMAQQNYQNLVTASERFMTGVVNAAVKQLELSRGLIQGGLEDFDHLSQARTPETFVQAELEVLRRRSERVMNAMQTLTEELTRAWGEALELAQPPRRAAESSPSANAKPPPAKPAS
ncbi:MAG: hypothetical protein JWO83_1018 [Caulobacteraceae bacterium]|nr:hypothetical protein [Caulobacteraceae bacterium]